MGFEPMPLSLGGRALIHQHTGNETHLVARTKGIEPSCNR